VSLETGSGVTVLVGSNGSGKTTLLRALATLCRPAAGSASVAGHDVRTRSGAAAARRVSGFLPQEPTALHHLRVAEALTYAAWLKGVPSRQRAGHVEEALAALDLVARADDRLGALSGGTRQRAYIGQAIVHRPDVVLLDEPSTGVDTEHRVELRAILRRLAVGRVVVFSTHLTEDIELLADRVVALTDGRLTFEGSPTELAALAGPDGSDAGTDEPARAIERGLRSLARP
jgi:ABC-2 type transport system ATP-binding protein